MSTLDIRELTKQFQEKSLDNFRDDNKLDLSAIDAINGTQLSSQERTGPVAQWIIRYKVHRIGGCTADNLARIVIDFADNNRSLVSPLTAVQINERFVGLERALQHGLHLNDPNAKERAIDSLTSKTLWLCYPHVVPILDLNAERALRMLARIHAEYVPKAGTRYETFIDAWTFFYSQIESVIALDQLYPYKIRVFDRLLWWLGQDSFPTADEILKCGIDVAP